MSTTTEHIGEDQGALKLRLNCGGERNLHISEE